MGAIVGADLPSEEYDKQSDKWSCAVWDRIDDIEKWETFMSHNYGSPSRYMAYHLLSTFIWIDWKSKVSVAEVGFGDGRDFAVFFRALHDANIIDYSGYEITPRFVRFAKQSFEGYRFKAGSYTDLLPRGYDIVYTRHTLEQCAPQLWKDSLTALLQASRKLCVIVFYKFPGRKEEIIYTGGWMNTYEASQVHSIIDEAGFALQIYRPVHADAIYWLERKAK